MSKTDKTRPPGEAKHWYVICYDITDPKRWRRAYRHLHGYGRRLQYSIFRCRLNARQLERLRWELETILTTEDKLLILSLCERCEQRVKTHNRPESWEEDPRGFDFA